LKKAGEKQLKKSCLLYKSWFRPAAHSTVWKSMQMIPVCRTCGIQSSYFARDTAPEQ